MVELVIQHLMSIVYFIGILIVHFLRAILRAAILISKIWYYDIKNDYIELKMALQKNKEEYNRDYGDLNDYE